MKYCNNCKWDNLDGDEPPCASCVQSNRYVRKRWLFLCWWIPKVLLITLALLLGGCVHVTLPDGTEYWRLGEQQIGEVLFTMPDGTEFLMVRQKSTIPVLIVTPAGWQLGEAKQVKQ